MTNIIPTPGIKGRWTVKDPFSVKIGTLYTLGAVRSFTDIENNGTNVYETYYATTTPQLSLADYKKDRKDGAWLLTLMSDTDAPIYIPSTYILTYPNLDSIPYHHVVISGSVGAIPVNLDLDHLITQLAAVFSDTIGIVPELHIGVVPLTSVVTPEQHATNEAKREAAISNRTTDYARLVEEQRKNTLIQQRLTIAEKIIKDHNLIP